MNYIGGKNSVLNAFLSIILHLLALYCLKQRKELQYFIKYFIKKWRKAQLVSKNIIFLSQAQKTRVTTTRKGARIKSKSSFYRSSICSYV